MPALTQDQIQDLVANDTIRALSPDTNIFHRFGYALTSKTLLALEQFRGSGIAVLLSSVVLGEVKKHMAAEASEKADKLRAALNQFGKAWRRDLDLAELDNQFQLSSDATAWAGGQLDAFVAQTGAQVLGPDGHVTPQALIDLYFEARPPFTAGGAKKDEFPDAIALMSIEAWAQAQGGMVLAISNDGDWLRFAEQSNHVVCLADLAEGLGLFHQASGMIALRVAQGLQEGKSPALRLAMESRLTDYVSEFDVEANSDNYYEVSDEEATLTGWDLTEVRPSIIEVDEHQITLSFSVLAYVEFSAYFSFQHWDSIDREYIRFPGAQAVREDTIDVQVVVTLSKDDLEDPEPDEVEIEAGSLTVDFGYVEPDWR